MNKNEEMDRFEEEDSLNYSDNEEIELGEIVF